MAWVSSGTVSVTNGSTTVTGTGTSWYGGLQNGWGFVGPDGRVYEILTVDDAATLTLKTPYQGATAGGQVYAAFPTGSLTADLTASLQELIANYQGVYDTVGQGRFTSDLVADNDRDTGLSWLASNHLGILVGGAVVAAMKAGKLGVNVQDPSAPLEVLGAPGVLAKFRDGVASNLLVQTDGNKTTIGNAAGSSRLALMAGNQEAIEFDSNGRASGAAVQSSPTDTTAGRLMTVPAFGLGVMDGMTSVDVDDMDTAPSGFGRISGNTTGVRPTGVTSGAVLTLANQDGRSSQLVFRAASNRVYARTKHDGAWRQWSEIFCSENLIGTVSHSGGTPTGAVIERGSNANGEYVRFADGTQICMSEVSTSASGGVSWTFPAAFAALVHYGGAAIAAAAPLFIACSSPTATSLLIHGWSAAEARSAFNCKVVAIGRWF
ncbi:pyocin knob domain-containing protein [Tritonibacter scottomollicae]|uniref:Uncharacterized protein n=1 Tax=Tritonibacter scottomollicae TaxID=483013 RepID=A0A2T1AII8_TRISK|nr:pyocin knob domain-containing protein [Tritonibacter scottomollicae]PRZ48357.1 hypothetical protein CLV89_104185 [Tritonibacter scottomollicae]